MKLNGRSITDDDIRIDCQSAVKAYEEFQRTRVRNSDENKDNSGGIAFEFDKAIRSRLQILEAIYPKAGMVFASKQTFSKWNNDPPKQSVKCKRSVLIAVLSITGIDVSSNAILARKPLDLSPMVELSPLKSKKLTNDPEEIEEVTFDVELSSILFKSAEMRVMSDWFVEEGDNKVRKKTHTERSAEVGTVVYGLTEAEVQIDIGETELIDWTRRVSPDTDPFLGKTDGSVMIWSDKRSVWIVQPLEGSPMRLRLEGIQLCKIRGGRGASIDLKVTATEDQIDSRFRMRVEPSQTNPITGEEIDNARNRLFSIMLSHRSDGDAVLAIQRHKLP